MPLVTSSFETLAADIKAVPAPYADADFYVLFSGAKNDEGKSWCPPCNAAAPDIKRVFEDSDKYYALVVYVKTSDFATECWPQKEWALLGVPMLYRLRNGELSGAAMLNEDLPFGKELDAYVLGEQQYEAYLETKQGDEYVDPQTRTRWAREDVEWHDEVSRARRETEEKRKAFKAEQAAKRKAAKAPTGEKGEKTEAEKAEVTVEPAEKGVCDGVTCSV